MSSPIPPNGSDTPDTNRSNRLAAGRAAKAQQPSLDLVRLEDRLTPVVSPVGALSGFVYEDFGSGVAASDNNGVKDANEAGISGVLITLTGPGGVTRTATTDGNGFYQFTGLAPGAYRVVETQPTAYSDGLDTPGATGGGTAAQDDTIAAITVTASAISSNNNFGELLGSLSGFVYQDYGSGTAANDDNGVKDTGEQGIAGTTVTLTAPDGTTRTTTTDANGAYSFTRLLLVPGYIVRETQPAGYNDGKDTAGTPGGGTAPQNDSITGVALTAVNRVSPNNNFGELLVPPPPPPAQLSGYVYEDDDNDGVKDANEAAIPGATVTLTGPNGTISVATTDVAGFYSFTNLLPGTYTVTETQPGGYLDGKDTAGTKGGVVTNDRVAAIPLVAGDNSVNNNFGELRPAQLSGYEYVDADDDGVKDAGEAPIGGVTVTLTGTDDLGASVTRTATTDPAGFYSFTALRPGSYTAAAAQPANFDDGKDTAGSKGGTVTNDQIAAITLAANDNSQNNNFGELVQVVTGALSGYVYEDFGGAAGTADNGSRDANEKGIAGVTVTLTLPDGTTRTTTTDANGFYRFTGLLPTGGYRVVQSQPAGYVDGKDTAGTTGGTVTNDRIDGVTVPAGGESFNNNFGELPVPPQPGSLSGFVYEDPNNNGLKEAGEAPIQGATVTLTAPDGTTRTTTTDANGFYSFTDLTPGNYTVVETQPAGFLDGKDTAGAKGGTVTNDRIATIPVTAGQESPNNNFGELRPATLSGFEYEDFGGSSVGSTDNGVKDAGEKGIAGVTVTLTGTDDLGASVTRTATTAADGSYSFTNLRPGTYSVAAGQPGGYVDGKDTAGTKGGTVTNDRIAAITLAANDNSQNNNFGELAIPPGTISGFVYVDADDDGVKDAGEAAIPGTTVTLTLPDGTTRTTTTDANGAYSFTNLTPGSYTVTETQPANFTDGKDTAGSLGGTVTNDRIAAIVLPVGGNSVNNNFGELVPVVPPAQLGGFVYYDADDDGVFDANEAPIPGTTVTLTGNGITRTTTTDANGFYSFTDLAPGNYTVSETQPFGYSDGKDTAGSKGGTVTNDRIAEIPLAAGDNSVNNNFGERFLSTLSGYVYVDADDDGVFDPGETPIANVPITVTGDNGFNQTITTDNNGFYAFTALREGTYTVVETQPTAYLDGKDTAGTKGGTVTNDRIAGIVLVGNDFSANNNFGELVPPAGVGSLSGYVYVDENDDGVKDAVEKPIAGVTVTLTGNGITRTTTTDANGFYRFTDLPAGSYTVTETQPANYDDGKDTAGVKGGVVTNDRIASIPVVAGQESPDNNFGEKRCFTLFGYVWFDQNQNGLFDPGEPGLGGVPVTISGTTATGRGLSTQLTSGQALTVFTDASGRYAFTCLPEGTYNLAQTNTPAGYQDFRSQNAAPGLTVASSTPISFGGIGLDRNAPGPLNFGKIVPGSTSENPGRPNPQRPSTNSKQDFLSSSSGATGAASPTSPLLTEPTVTLNLNPSYNNGGAATRYIVGTAGAGYLPVVRVFDAATGGEKFRFLAYDARFTGGVAATAADVTGDGVDDIITAAGVGGAPHIKVFDGVTGAEVRSFFAYDTRFRGGAWVAAGDFDNDGVADIVTGAGEGGASHVRVWNAAGGLIRDFFAFDTTITGGARVAVGDFNGDGKADIAAATGIGVAPQVALFDGQTNAVLNRLTVYETGFTAGVFLAAGDVNGDGRAEVVTGVGQGGGARVRVLTAAGNTVYDFLADAATFTGGVRVAARDVTGDGQADVITGGGVGGFARVQVYSGANLARLDDFYLFDSGVKTGVYVG